MRPRPLLLVLYAVPVLFLVLRTPVRDALEVAVQAAVARLRHPFGATGREGPLPAPPRAVQAFLESEWSRAGVDACAHVVAVHLAGDRSHVVVDRGSEDGVSVGDVAGFRASADGPLCLVGEVDAVTGRFARVRSVADAEAWWLARAESGRLILTRATDGRGLAIGNPENKSALRGDVARRGVVTTEADRHGDRVVPAGLLVGRLTGRADEGEDGWRVEPFFEPRRVLGLCLLGGGRVRTFGRVETRAEGWWPVRVVRSWDANPLRASVLVRCEGGGGTLPPDAPVARGAYLEGWVHTAAGRTARIRLVDDPGFYCHVLVLRPDGDRLTSPGGAVFRGGHREGNRIHGRCLEFRSPPRPGDRLVVGPYQGGGGVGLLVGEVVSWSPGGFVVLERPGRPARGDGLWVGRFPRPPRDLASRLDDAR